MKNTDDLINALYYLVSAIYYNLKANDIVGKVKHWYNQNIKY